MGSIVNTRIISIVSGGILFGPMVGITAGVFSGIHRYFMDIGDNICSMSFIKYTSRCIIRISI